MFQVHIFAVIKYVLSIEIIDLTSHESCVNYVRGESVLFIKMSFHV